MIYLRKAALDTAAFWQRQYTSEKPIVLFSGGSKSEIVLRSLLEANLQPRVLYLKTICSNWLEMQRALIFCREHTLELEILDADEFKAFAAAGISWNEILNYSSVEFSNTLIPLLLPDGLAPIYSGNGIVERETGRNKCSPDEECAIIPFFSADIFQKALLNDPLYLEWLELRKEVPFETIAYWLDYIFKASWPDFSPRSQCTLKSTIIPFMRKFFESSRNAQHASGLIA